MPEEISERTRLEMEAGAKALALRNGMSITPEYLATIKFTQERNQQLRAWERAGKVRIEDSQRVRSGNVWRERAEDDPLRREPWSRQYHVLPKRDGPVFNDIDAERAGASPSEVLIANIALALQAMGEL